MQLFRRLCTIVLDSDYCIALPLHHAREETKMKFDAIRVQREIEHYRSETAYRFAFKATERFSTALLAKSNSSDGNWWIQLSPCETVNFFRKAEALAFLAAIGIPYQSS
jgi:hypothetical protein